MEPAMTENSNSLTVYLKSGVALSMVDPVSVARTNYRGLWTLDVTLADGTVYVITNDEIAACVMGSGVSPETKEAFGYPGTAG
jgi:hypothetical protein